MVKLLTKWRLSVLQQYFFAVKLIIIIIIVMFVFVSHALFSVFGKLCFFILLFVLLATWLLTEHDDGQEMIKVILNSLKQF